MSDKFSTLTTPKDCNAELSSKKAPPLPPESLPLTPISVSTSTSTSTTSTPPTLSSTTTTKTTTTTTTTTATKTSTTSTTISTTTLTTITNANIGNLVEPKDDFFLYDFDGDDGDDGGHDSSLFAGYCGPIGAEDTGYPDDFSFFPGYEHIQIRRSNEES